METTPIWFALTYHFSKLLPFYFHAIQYSYKWLLNNSQRRFTNHSWSD